MRKNVASQVVAFQMVSSTDGSAVTTGTPTVYYTVDGGTQGTGGGTAAHEGNGQWSYAPAQAETNGNHVAFTMVLSGAISQTVNVYPVGYDETATYMPSNVIQAAGIAWGSGAITPASIASNAITSAKIAASAIGASQIATDAITAAKIAANAIGASELAADAVTEINSAILSRLGTPSNADIAADIAEVNNTANTIQGHTGNISLLYKLGTSADANGTNTTVILPTSQITVDDQYIGDIIWFSDYKHSAVVTACSDSTNTLTFEPGLPGSATTSTNDSVTIIPNSRSLGIAGTITTLDALDASQDSQHAATQTLIGMPAADLAADVAAVKADTAATLLDTNELQTDWANGGRLDIILDAILAMLDDPRGEPGQTAPPVSADLATKVDYLYKRFRNKKDQDGTTWKLYADDGTTVDQQATISEAAGTTTFGEVASG